MPRTAFIAAEYTDVEMTDDYVFHLVERGANTVYTVNGHAVFDSDYHVIRTLRREAERTTGRFLEIRACRISDLPGH
jgi:hypothetical protein